MKRTTKTTIAKLPEQKLRKRWRSRVITILDGWSTNYKKLTLINGAETWRVQHDGRLVKAWKGTYLFVNQSEMRVFLSPDEWKSVQFEESRGIVLVIDGRIGEGGFILRESDWEKKKPDPIVIPGDVMDQLALWAKNRTFLILLLHRVGHTMTLFLRASEFSERRFFLYEETTMTIHVFHLDNCLRLQFRKEDELVMGEQREGRSVCLWYAEQTVDIGAFSGSPKDVLASFGGSNLIH